MPVFSLCLVFFLKSWSKKITSFGHWVLSKSLFKWAWFFVVVVVTSVLQSWLNSFSQSTGVNVSTQYTTLKVCTVIGALLSALQRAAQGLRALTLPAPSGLSQIPFTSFTLVPRWVVLSSEEQKHPHM